MAHPGRRSLLLLLLLASCQAPPERGAAPASPGPAAATATSTGATSTGATATAEGASTAGAAPGTSLTAAPGATSVATSGATTLAAAPSTSIASSPPATPLEVAEAQALVPGGATPLSPTDLTTVEPACTFRLVLKGRFPEARLSLLEGDAMVPSAGAREAGATTTLSLQPAAALRPGARYRLRVDGATRREIAAADGTQRSPAEWALLAAGEPPVEHGKAKPKKPARANR